MGVGVLYERIKINDCGVSVDTELESHHMPSLIK